MIATHRGFRPRSWAALLLGLALAGHAAAADDDASAHESAGAPQPLVVMLESDVQQAAGIGTITLEAIRRRPQARASARVLALAGLLDSQIALAAAAADAEAARAARDASRDNYARLRTLHAENANISGRDLAKARAEARADTAHVEAAEAKTRALEAGIRQRWGAPVARWLAADTPPEPWQAVLNGDQALALLRLSSGQRLPDGVDTIRVASDGGDPREAIVVAPAAGPGGPLTGQTWLLRLPAQGLRAGMRLAARVPQQGEARTGVLVPDSAVVWQDGRPWVYIRTGPARFQRRPLPATRDGDGGERFVTEGLNAGDVLVTRGAALLLAQELRTRIPEEDDD